MTSFCALVFQEGVLRTGRKTKALHKRPQDEEEDHGAAFGQTGSATGHSGLSDAHRSSSR